MSIINGTDLMVFVAGKSIAYATNHTLSTSAETTATSTKTKDNTGGSWNTSKITTFSWSVSTENLYTTDKTNGITFEDLFNSYKTGTKVNLKFCVKKESTVNVPTLGWTPAESGIIYSGSAYITSLELNAPDGENASFSVEFTGDGELSITGSSAGSSSYQGSPTDTSTNSNE